MAFYFQKVKRHYFFIADLSVYLRVICVAVVRLKVIVVLIFMLGAVSCSKRKTSSEEIPIARAYDKILHKPDIEEVAKGAESKDDSVVKVNAFIEQWLRQQVLLYKAEQILDEEKKDVEQQ